MISRSRRKNGSKSSDLTKSYKGEGSVGNHDTLVLKGGSSR